MRYALTLGVVLMANWLLWSGHLEPFLIALGAISVIVCVWLTARMGILDSETVPLHLGARPFTHFAPWLLKEIVVSNLQVAKIILSPQMPLQRNMVTVTAHQKSEIGRVIFANSITATPGTVSVRVEGDQIQVHALSFAGAAEDLAGEMDRRVTELES